MQKSAWRFPTIELNIVGVPGMLAREHYQFRNILHRPFYFQTDNLELDLAFLIQRSLIILWMLHKLEH
jgi:hypothetical protein